MIQMPNFQRDLRIKKQVLNQISLNLQKKPKSKIKQKNIFQSSRIVSNLSKTLLQKYSALKHVSEFKEKFNLGKLASTAKMEPKHKIFKKLKPTNCMNFTKLNLLLVRQKYLKLSTATTHLKLHLILRNRQAALQLQYLWPSFQKAAPCPRAQCCYSQ